MLPFAATFVGVAAALAMSGGAARALETDKTLSGPQRGVATLAAQPWEAFTAPFQKYLGSFSASGKFGATSFFTGEAPAIVTNALQTFRTILLPNHSIESLGIAPSPFNLGTNGMGEASKALQFFSHWSLLMVDGAANLMNSAAPPELKSQMNKITRSIVGIADRVRWHTDSTVNQFLFGSAQQAGA
jgi:hypothetical protein